MAIIFSEESKLSTDFFISFGGDFRIVTSPLGHHADFIGINHSLEINHLN